MPDSRSDDFGRHDAKPTAASPPRYESRQLFGEANEIIIEHSGALYRLRRTSLGKLILTK